MNTLRYTLNAVGILTLSLVFSVVTQAQVNHAFVSTSGDDLNPCSRTHPCESISRALIAVGEGGEVIILDSGSYQPFVVNKSVSIIAAPGIVASINAPDSTVTAITIRALRVVLRGLTITGTIAPHSRGIGVFIDSTRVLHIQNCVLNGLEIGILFQSPGAAYGASANLFVTDTTVMYSLTGIDITFEHDHLNPGTPSNFPSNISIDRVRLEMVSNGLVVDDNAKVTIRDSVVAKNTFGFRTFGGDSTVPVVAELNIENCVATNNYWAMSADGRTGASIIHVSNSTIANNGNGLMSSGIGKIISFGNNRFAGNDSDGSFTSSISLR